MPNPAPYPPLQHMLADLRIAVRPADGGVEVGVPAPPEVLDGAGSVGAAALGIAVDVLGGHLALREVAPDWCVTSTLSLHRLRPLTDAFTVRGAPLRSGRTQVVLDVAVGDGAAEPAAVGRMTFTRVPRRPETTPYREPDDAGYGFGDETSGLAKPLLEQLGCRVRDAARGEVELPLGDYVRNSIGTLQGGAVVALVGASAEAWAGAHLGSDATPLDLEVHFLALGRVGPMRARATTLASSAHDARLRVELVDSGADDRLAAVATVRLGAF